MNCARYLPILVLGLCLNLSLLCGSALAAKRVALVIGISKYDHIRTLENPRNDAELIASVLEELDFYLIGGGPHFDLDKPAFERLVQQFGRSITSADAALFYFAGHGVQVNGNNYLIPSEANPVREADVDFEMVNANLVLRQMEGSGSKLNMLILDACRNNPFGGRGFRSAAAGLAQMQAPEGTIISFATQPGNVALDGNDGNSPYTKALADTLKRPGLDIFRTFNEVGVAVSTATSGQQQPWVSLSPIRGEFYFAPRGEEQTAAAEPIPSARLAPPASPQPEQDGQVNPEFSLWGRIKDSKEPALLKLYLDQYPNGVFARVARTMLDAAEEEADRNSAARQIEIGREHQHTQPSRAITHFQTAAAIGNRWERGMAFMELSNTYGRLGNLPGQAEAIVSSIESGNITSFNWMKREPANGPSRELIGEVQKVLKRKGYYSGTTDGVRGQATHDALAAALTRDSR